MAEVQFAYPTEKPDAGISPDVFLEPTLRDIAQGRDAEMAKVYELIRGGGSLNSR